MKTFCFLSLVAVLALGGCASGHFSSSVKNVGVNTVPPKEVVILSPDKANVFNTVAHEQTTWLEAQLRGAITHQLSQSDRFQSSKRPEDGQIVFNALRHGVLEVSPNNFAVQIVAEVSLFAKNGKKVGDREFTSTSGDVQPLSNFEDSKVYQESLTSAAEKLALELVSDL